MLAYRYLRSKLCFEFDDYYFRFGEECALTVCLLMKDITSGKTPVHIAVEKRDPFLLELLLSKCPGSANAPMYNDNRPLHSAATLTEVTDTQQLELVNILLKYGADKALRNKANKLPIELVQQDRDRVSLCHETYLFDTLDIAARDLYGFFRQGKPIAAFSATTPFDSPVNWMPYDRLVPISLTFSIESIHDFSFLYSAG